MSQELSFSTLENLNKVLLNCRIFIRTKLVQLFIQIIIVNKGNIFGQYTLNQRYIIQEIKYDVSMPCHAFMMKVESFVPPKLILLKLSERLRGSCKYANVRTLLMRIGLGQCWLLSQCLFSEYIIMARKRHTNSKGLS